MSNGKGEMFAGRREKAENGAEKEEKRERRKGEGGERRGYNKFLVLVSYNHTALYSESERYGYE